MATKIKTGQIVDIGTYVDNKDNIVLSSAAADALSKANTAETNANAYTDAEVVTLNSSITSGDAATLASAGLDATTKANAAEANAKGYVDTKISTELYTRTLIDSKDTTVLNSANSYTDGQTGITLTTANSNAQFWDTLVLASAKDYTDGQVGSAGFGPLKYIDAYTDGSISGNVPITSVTLTTDIDPQIVYVEGIRYTTLIDSHTFTASVDTYVDVDNAGVLVFTETALGAGDPGVVGTNLRLFKVVTDGTSVTSVIDQRVIIEFYQNDAEVIAAVQPELDLKQNILAEGAFINGDKTKLDGIEANAKDDQIASEVPYTNTTSGLIATNVQTAVDEVEGRLDTAETKLSGIEAGATADQVWGEIGGTLSNQTDLQNALNAKQDNLTFDLVPTDLSTNPVESNGVFDALATKQDNLTFDLVPTDASTNPVESNGVFDALALKASLNTNVSFTKVTTPTVEATTDNLILNTLGAGSLIVQNDSVTKFSLSETGTIVNYGSMYPAATDITHLGSATFKFGNGYINNVFTDGVKFSGSATVLDYYQEGTFTPTFDFGTGVVYTAQSGSYTKIGNVVNVDVVLTVSAIDNTTDASAIHIGGLPFNFINSGNIIGNVDTFNSTLLSGTGISGINFSSISGTGRITISSDAGTQYLYNSGILNSSGTIIISVQYKV